MHSKAHIDTLNRLGNVNFCETNDGIPCVFHVFGEEEKCCSCFYPIYNRIKYVSIIGRLVFLRNCFQLETIFIY